MASLLSQEFSCWKDLFAAVDKYSSKTSQPFVRASCKTCVQANKRIKAEHRPYPLEMEYVYYTFACTHSGLLRPTGKGKRKTRSKKLACEAKIHACLDRHDRRKIVIKQLNEVHNHAISKDRFESYVKQRRLNEVEKSKVKELVKLNISPKDMTAEMVRLTGKRVTIQDVRNIKKTVIKKGKKMEVLDQTTAAAFNVKEEGSAIIFPSDNSFYPQNPLSSSNTTTSTTRRSENVIMDSNNPNNIVGFYSPQQQLPSQSQIAQIPNQDHHAHSHYDKNNSGNSNNINHNLLNSIKNSLKSNSSNFSPHPPAKRPREDSNCNNSFVEDEDEFYRQAKVWAKDVSKMSPDQQLFAKKAINDIIFEGLMGSLHRNSVKINQDYNNGGFVGNNVVAGQPEAAVFVPDNDDQEEVSSSGSMSPPPVSFQT